MKISNTNVFTSTTLSVTSDDDPTQSIADVVTGDFSTAYTSVGTDANFTISKTLGLGTNIEYVAIAGHTFGSSSGLVTLEIRVNNILKDTVLFFDNTRNDVVFVHFDVVLATSIEIKVIKATASNKITISYISAGELLPFTHATQNQERAGYPRVWLTDSKKVRATINDAAAPVAYVRQTITRKITLNITDVSVLDTDIFEGISPSPWLALLDRIYNNGDFFIKERDGSTVGIADEPKSSYMCFNAEMAPPKAHGATRKLNNISIKFNAFTGH